MKHTSSRVLTCPAEKPLALRRSWLLTNPAAPPALKWRADIYLCFLSGSVQFFVLNTAFLCLFFCPFWGHLPAQLLLRHCLLFEFELELLWPGEGRHCACAGEGHCPIALCREGGCQVCTRVIDTSQTLPLTLIGCVGPGAADSCRSNYSHWVEPQTADLYLILLSDHNDNFR